MRSARAVRNQRDDSTIRFEKGWLKKARPGVPFRMVEAPEEDEGSNRSLKELGDLLTVDEVAARLKLHRITVYEMVGAKKIKAIRLGRLIRISTAALEDFLNA